MENKFEERLKLGYEEYLKLPKAEPGGPNKGTDLYRNGWCVLEGRSMMHPHPHRHYTLLEFAYWCGADETLHGRFLNSNTKS